MDKKVTTIEMLIVFATLLIVFSIVGESLHEKKHPFVDRATTSLVDKQLNCICK